MKFSISKAHFWFLILSLCPVSAHCVEYSVPGDFSTIQACANAAGPGDTCLVKAGRYEEFVTVNNSGTQGRRIVFLAEQGASCRGFRLGGAYITVSGFDITGCEAGSMIRIGKDAHHAQILNNTIRDGIGGAYDDLVFKDNGPNGDTITSAIGGFLSAGFKPGITIFMGAPDSGPLLTGNKNGKVIKAVTNNVLTLADGQTLVDQGPMYAYIHTPVGGISFDAFGNLADAARNALIKGNSVFNLHANLVSLMGENHVVEGNNLYNANGFDFFRPFGRGHVIRDNFMHDSSMIRGNGEHPDIFQVFDLIDNITVSSNILITNNFVYKTANYQLSQLTIIKTHEPGGPRSPFIKDWTFKNNVFVEIGLGGTMNIPDQKWINNIFVRDNKEIGSNPINFGEFAQRAVVKNNVFIDNGNGSAASGWYALFQPMASSSVMDFNFVSGPSPTYSPKQKRPSQCSTSFAPYDFCEPNGINGGDPKLFNIDDPLGPDLLPFTEDDGLRPFADSVLCKSGENGIDRGPYGCSNSATLSNEVIQCSLNNIRCVDSVAGPNQEYSTIQACANAAQPGDTCVVFPGVYLDHVQTVRGGTEGSPIIFKAQYDANHPFVSQGKKATMQGFRIKHPYIVVRGFDITKYSAGLDMAHVMVEPEGDYFIFENSVIRDGIFLLSNQFFFDSQTKRITHAAGGFTEAGFKAGASIYIGSNINREILNANKVKKIKSVTNTTIELADDQTLISEGPVFALLFETRTGRSGVSGLAYNITSKNGGASHTIVRGNKFLNLGGQAINLGGSHHVVEKNTFEKMNGWGILTIQGHDNIFRYNHFKNSPRYSGFEWPITCAPGQLPGNGCAPDQFSGGHWDFVDQVLTMYGSPSIKTTNNTFEFNFIDNLDNQFMNVKQILPGYNGPMMETGGFIFRNNVVYRLEAHGSFTFPESVIVNNTFYKAAYRSSSLVFVVSNGEFGKADRSLVRNNVFVECNKLIGDSGNIGWYSIHTDPVYGTPKMAEDPNYNFVSGAASQGYPSKSGFNSESKGINGGNPRFQNIDNPLGPDGVPFTSDDGLRPLSDSPLCKAGYAGADLGAYTCVGNSSVTKPGDSDSIDIDPIQNVNHQTQFMSFNNVIKKDSPLHVSYSLGIPGHVTFAVRDRKGAVIYSESDGYRFVGGPYVYVWDGKNSSKQPVASGVYQLEMDVDGHKTSKKIVVVR